MSDSGAINVPEDEQWLLNAMRDFQTGEFSRLAGVVRAEVKEATSRIRAQLMAEGADQRTDGMTDVLDRLEALEEKVAELDMDAALMRNTLNGGSQY